jgi:hypothetical protein
MALDIPLIIDREDDSPFVLMGKKAVRFQIHTFIKLRGLMDKTYPWLAAGAVKWLRAYLTESMNGYEWGSGRSTLFFAERAHHLVSVEHDEKWHLKVKKWVTKSKMHRVELVCIPPMPGTKNTSPEYYNHILNYPHGSFDFVLVDGRMRIDCARNSMAKIKPDGILIYDDSHRNQRIFSMLEGWELRNFRNGVTQTSIFRKP